MGLDGIEWDYVNQDMKHHCIIRNVALVAKINGVSCFLFEFNYVNRGSSYLINKTLGTPN